MDRVLLVGAEEVSSAASRISQAASDMKQAVSSLDGVLFQHRQFMDDWLQRLEAILHAAQTGENK